MTQFYGKTKICYGKDALEVLHGLPIKQAFIVTDAFMVKVGFIDRLESHLELGGIAHKIFADVEPDPSLETITKGVSLFMQAGADAVIALGGGSVIDAAKAISFFAAKIDPAQPKPLLIAIPTTSGTGAEVTAVSVVTDKANAVKIPLNNEELIPDMAILDARFTRTLPPGVTSVTGMDVLTHAIEAYTAKNANAFTSLYARYAIRYVFAYLPKAYSYGEDMQAREMMLLASCMAGMAFNNSGLGITHSIAHSLGGLYHIPHGLANAVVLPFVMQFNSFDAAPQYREIAQMLGLPADSSGEGTTSLIQAVRDLNESMNIPGRVGALDIDEKSYHKHMDTMAKNVLEDICTTTNPRTPSHDDIKMLLQQAW